MTDAAITTETEISPLSLVTAAAVNQVGVPPDATSFAFIYPMNDAQALVDRLTAPESKDAWMFVVILGGFAYFNKDEELLAVNAISLTPSAMTSH